MKIFDLLWWFLGIGDEDRKPSTKGTSVTKPADIDPDVDMSHTADCEDDFDFYEADVEEWNE